jgi:uncharacterized protein YihD (DUF1040 family)
MNWIIKFCIIFFYIIGILSCKHIETKRKMSVDIVQDLREDVDIKNAQFIVDIDSEKIALDTLTAKKINTNWIETVSITSLNKEKKRDNKKDSVIITLRKEYNEDFKKLIEKK